MTTRAQIAEIVRAASLQAVLRPHCMGTAGRCDGICYSSRHT